MELLENYHTYLQTVGLSRHTVQGYRSDLESFRQWFSETRGEKFEPANITPRDLFDYKGFLLTIKDYQTATVNRRLSSISRFLKWAKSQGITETVPPEKLQVKVEQDWAPRSLDRNEQNALMREVAKRANRRDMALISLLLGTGLRSSEVAGLKVDDVEILGRSASEQKGWVHVRAGKGGAPRDIPLNSDVRKALRNYLEQLGETESGYLFSGQRGALTVKGIAYIVRKYAYQARLEHCTVHTMRHTFAKNLIDAGVSIDRVGLLLGHESLDTTRIYTKPSKADLEREVEKLAPR
jgi:site-specific recombinase XerD